MNFGIIGYGSFGKLVAEVLSEFGEVKVYTRTTKEQVSGGIKFTSFEDVAAAKVIILAVGLNALDEVTKKLAGLVQNNTLVVDVCSVKVKPIQILNENLGGKCRTLA